MSAPFDSKKSAANLVKHGVGFEAVHQFEWPNSLTWPDTRFDYGEERFITYAPIGGRVYVLIWTLRGGHVRPISLRKANIRERKRYEKEWKA